MPLFEVDKDTKRVEEIKPRTFPELRLWERQDLEAWVTSAPELAGGDFTVITSEFDRFDRTSERLDILGIVPIEPGHGRLVVIELKRDGTSTTVDLQAIKYAAYVAAAQFADVVDMYSRHHQVDEEDARATLLELLGGSDDDPPLIDDTPRIVLVAGDFRAEVTTTVLWLVDNFEEMDIRCVRLQPFAVGDRLLVHSEVLIPLPEAEQYRLGVQRKRREVARGQEQKARAGRLLPRLLEAGALEVGQVLYFRRTPSPTARDRGARASSSIRRRSSPARASGYWSGSTRVRGSRCRTPRRCWLPASCTASADARASFRAPASTACTTGPSTARSAFGTWAQRWVFSTALRATSIAMLCARCAPRSLRATGPHTAMSLGRSAYPVPPNRSPASWRPTIRSQMHTAS
jgi:hypothetical protein